MSIAVVRDTAWCCVFCCRTIKHSVLNQKNHFKGQLLSRYSSSEQFVENCDPCGRKHDSEFEIRKLLRDSQISMQTPLDNDHVNLDENSGEFKSGLNAKTVMYLHQPRKETPDSRFDLETKSAYMFAGDSANMDSVFVERLTREPQVKQVFDEASSIVGYNVLDLCLNGSPSVMHEVKYSDVATFTLSMGELAWIKRHRPLVHSGLIMAAGIGVGEISALVAAGAITMSQALKLVKDRSEALEQASNLSEGGLALIYGSKKTNFAELCHQLASFGELGGIDAPVCSIAMHLHSCTKVIGGHMQCLKHLKGLQKEFNIRKFSILDSSVAFHTNLMKPAVEPFAVSLKDIVFNDPKTWSSSVYSCVTGMRYKRDDFAMKNSYKAKLLLLKQLTSPVKWETVANRLAQRGRNNEYPNYFEVGTGSFIRNSFKEINNRAASRCRDLKSFIQVVEKREFGA